VIGGGVDLASSPEDPALVEDLIEAGGGILAEVAPGTPVRAQSLVARDRLQSGLSVAVVVVQTDLASGTMHTVRFTVVQGRLLAAVRPPTGERRWAGNAALCSPEGCPPEAVHAGGAAAAAVAARRPLADLVLDGSDLSPLYRRLGL